ncbi:glycosyltransferase family 2 protein [Bacteroides congonensis]
MTGTVILNYNNSSDTINCIKSVVEYNTADVKFVVVDNGSTDGTCVAEIDFAMKSLFPGEYVRIEEGNTDKGRVVLPKAVFFVGKGNVGYAQGNNKGLDLLYRDDTVDNVLILNSDILFVSDVIPQLEHYLSVLPQCAIVSPLLLGRDREHIDYSCARKAKTLREFFLENLFLHHDIFGFLSKMNRRIGILSDSGLLNEKSIEIELPSGSCMLLDKSFFRQIGSFDPRTFLFYEENILHAKVRREGRRNYLIPYLKVVHLAGTSMNKETSFFREKKGRDSLIYYLKAYTGAGRFYLIAIRFLTMVNMYYRAYVYKKLV